MRNRTISLTNLGFPQIVCYIIVILFVVAYCISAAGYLYSPAIVLKGKLIPISLRPNTVMQNVLSCCPYLLYVSSPAGSVHVIKIIIIIKRFRGMYCHHVILTGHVTLTGHVFCAKDHGNTQRPLYVPNDTRSEHVSRHESRERET